MQGEYFWDNDPGAGSGETLIALDGNFNEAIESVFADDISMPSEGTHVFNIRLMDEDGIWGSTFSKPVQILFITIYGCTDDLACNYSSQSNTDDGTCIYPPEFYDCEGECLLDQDNDGICDLEEIVGCQDNNACNYNPLATESGICYIPEGCDTCLDTLSIQNQIENSASMIQSYESEIAQLNLQIASITNANDSSAFLISYLEEELASLQGDITMLQNAYVSVPPSMQPIIQAQIDNLTIEMNSCRLKLT